MGTANSKIEESNDLVIVVILILNSLFAIFAITGVTLLLFLREIGNPLAEPTERVPEIKFHISEEVLQFISATKIDIKNNYKVCCSELEKGLRNKHRRFSMLPLSIQYLKTLPKVAYVDMEASF